MRLSYNTKKYPKGMAMAIHFLRANKIFYPEDGNLCVAWSSRQLDYTRGENPDQPMWEVPDSKMDDPGAEKVPVIRYRGKLIEAWRIEWYRNTGRMPKPWQDVRRTCDNPDCMSFHHMELVETRSKKNLAREIISRTAPPDENGCRIWLGSRTNGDPPYPYIYYRGRTVAVRTLIYRSIYSDQARPEYEDPREYEMIRVMIEDIKFDPVPPGYVVSMTCGNSLCIEPTHMEKRRREVRLNRGSFKAGGAKRPPATQCRNGHPYEEDSFYLDKNGKRVCRICQRKRVERYRSGNIPLLEEGGLPWEVEDTSTWQAPQDRVEIEEDREEVEQEYAEAGDSPSAGVEDIDDWLKNLGLDGEEDR